jgi:hypothetical protein
MKCIPIPILALFTHAGTEWADWISAQVFAVQIGLPAGQGPASGIPVAIEPSNDERGGDEPSGPPPPPSRVAVASTSLGPESAARPPDEPELEMGLASPEPTPELPLPEVVFPEVVFPDVALPAIPDEPPEPVAPALSLVPPVDEFDAQAAAPIRNPNATTRPQCFEVDVNVPTSRSRGAGTTTGLAFSKSHARRARADEARLRVVSARLHRRVLRAAHP